MTRAAHARFVLAVACAVGACNPVDALQGAHYVGPQNVCSDSCPDGAACNDGQCRAQSVTYGLILDVTPPTTAHYAGGSTFRFGPYANPSAGQLNETLSLARVSIRLDATGVTDFDKPIAMAVRLVEHADDSAPVPSAILRHYEFQTDAKDLTTLAKGIGLVSFEVPSGVYDVYVAPLDTDVVAVLPPVLRLSQPLTSGELDFVVGPLPMFSLRLTDVDGTDLFDTKNDGWDVSVIDRVTGRTLSTIDTTCAHPSSAQLSLTPGLTAHTYSVRFSPPASGCATTELRPNYDFDLDALDLGGTGKGTAVLPSMASVHKATKDAPIAVQFGGWVVPANTKAPGPTDPKPTPPSNGLPATIYLRSEKISLPATWRTGNAWYATQTGSTVRTSSLEPGAVAGVQVPAGNYDIELIPDIAFAPQYGVTTMTNFVLTQSPDTLRTYFPANPKTWTMGEIVGSDKTTVFGIGNVDFIPETPPTTDVTAFVQSARSQSVSVIAPVAYDTTECHPADPANPTKIPHTYNFNAFLDAGSTPLYDVVVRTPISSGFPWAVLQQVEISLPSNCAPLVDLGKIIAVSPAQFTGTILDENGDPVAFANVEARAIIASSDGKTLVSAPVVGQTQADEKGNYTLLVPSKLDTFQTVLVTK